MPPKTLRRKTLNDASNARSLRRREAVSLLNGLAVEVGLKKVPVKALASRVEALVRLLDPRCQAGALPARLRSAVGVYLGNGGAFAAAVLPACARAAAAEDAHCDADGDAPPPMARHRLLEAGFRLESKAFMLTFNSGSFVRETWPVFLEWVKERRGALGARRWAACITE